MQALLAKLAKPRRPPFVGGAASSRGVAKRAAQPSKKTARRRSHQVNVRRERVHILALVASPWMHPGRGELLHRTWKDPRCSIIFMPRIEARPGRIGKLSYGLRLESYRLWMLSHQSPGRRFGFLRPLKWPGIAEISPSRGSSLRQGKSSPQQRPLLEQKLDLPV